MFTWETRRQCKTKQDAIEALASVPKLCTEEILLGEPETAMVLLGQVQEFADHWNVPFDRYTMLEAAKEFSGKSSTNGWDSSSADCW